MNDEIVVLERMLPQMGEVMNIIPGERMTMRDSETLLIIQRRMADCDIRNELAIYNELFAGKDGLAKEAIVEAAKAYVKIRILINLGESNFNPVSLRELIKAFKALDVKVSNIINLSKVNMMTADDYQKERIALTEEKNRAFLEAFEKEVEILEKRIERMPVPKEELSDDGKKKDVIPKSVPVPETSRANVIAKIGKKVTAAKEQKVIEEELKNVEKSSSTMMCVEIPFYDKRLNYTEEFRCKDIPAYSILKRKNNVYFGLKRNVHKNFYDNSDQSLLELTEATEEFLQYMTEDLLSGDYDLQQFSDTEKQGLRMYFDFMTKCFNKYIGVTLTVQEYLDFKAYYNRLVCEMFSLEKEGKQKYYKALVIAEEYLAYMDSYNLECVDELGDVIDNIINLESASYVNDIELIIANHVVDEDARLELEELEARITHFHVKKEPEKLVVSEEEKLPISPTYDLPLPMYCFPQAAMPVPQIPVVNQGMMQIVVQILNQDREVVDEAVYAGNNIKQALYDYSTRDAVIKRLGFRNNGQDMFFDGGI